MYDQHQSCQCPQRKLPPISPRSAVTGHDLQADSAVQPLIFIVDDDEAIREALAMLFESIGWNTRAYQSAEQFLSHYSESDNCCLVLDMQMPGMSGAELLERLRNDGKDIPVIVITAFPENSLTRRALSAGADAVLTKPFNDESLLAEIYKAMAINSR